MTSRAHAEARCTRLLFKQLSHHVRSRLLQVSELALAVVRLVPARAQRRERFHLVRRPNGAALREVTYLSRGPGDRLSHAIA